MGTGSEEGRPGRSVDLGRFVRHGHRPAWLQQQPGVDLAAARATRGDVAFAGRRVDHDEDLELEHRVLELEEDGVLAVLAVIVRGRAVALLAPLRAVLAAEGDRELLPHELGEGVLAEGVEAGDAEDDETEHGKLRVWDWRL